MDSKHIDGFRQQLIRSREQLQALEEMAKESTRPVELDQAAIGRLSRMDAMQGQQMALETARRRQQQLQRIEAALRRIDAGEYGECEVCGGVIDPRRLAIEPTATRCIDCVRK